MKKALAVLTLAVVCIVAGVVMAAPAHHRPAVQHFRFAPATFAVPSSAGTGRSGHRRATTIRFRLTAPAGIRIAIARRAAGRKVGRRCVAPRHRLAKRPACRRWVRVARLRWSRHKAGRVALPFSGHAHGRALKPGAFRAAIVAVRANGRRSKVKTTRFRVVRTRRRPAGATPVSPPASTPGAPSAAGMPSASTTGVPAGWTPAQTRSTNMTVTTAGSVVQDIRFTNGASLDIAAPNVTVRRVELQGGQINNEPGPKCQNGLVVEDSSFLLQPGQAYDPKGTPGIQWGGYTARRVKVWYRSEGLFIGGKSAGCGPVTIEDSLIKLDDHGDCNLHADGMQGYDGNSVTVRNVISDSNLATCGTAPFFYPKNQGNVSANIDHLMVIGGGYSFRDGMPSNVHNLQIVDNPPGGYHSGHSWAYGPIDVNCSAMQSWDASIVTTTPDYQVTRVLRSQPCNTNGGN